MLERAPVVVQLSVLQTAAQFGAFEIWFTDTLRGGVDTFSIDLRFGADTITLFANFATRYRVQTIGQNLNHGRLSFELECYEAESTAFSHSAPVFIRAGTAAAPSTVDDWIRAGTAAAPSTLDPVIWGGRNVGFEDPM